MFRILFQRRLKLFPGAVTHRAPRQELPSLRYLRQDDGALPVSQPALLAAAGFAGTSWLR